MKRFLCWFGFHRITAFSVWWPHETKCDRCGKTLLMDTRGEWFVDPWASRRTRKDGAE
jgi:hypothetical protein